MSTDDLMIETQAIEPLGVIALSGSMRLRDAPAVLTALCQAIDRSLHRVVVCDVSRLLPPTAPSMLTVFPTALRRCGGWPHSSLHLAGPGPDLLGALRAIRMQRYLPVHQDLVGALAAAQLDAVIDSRELSLPGEPASLRATRRAAGELFPLADPGGREGAVMVANELAANVIKHVGTPFHLAMTLSRDRMVIAVSDPSRREPILRPPRGTVTDGRGLQLVAGLTKEWGVRLLHPGGKTVWASLSAPARLVPAARGPVDSSVGPSRA